MRPHHSHDLLPYSTRVLAFRLFLAHWSCDCAPTIWFITPGGRVALRSTGVLAHKSLHIMRGLLSLHPQLQPSLDERLALGIPPCRLFHRLLRSLQSLAQPWEKGLAHEPAATPQAHNSTTATIMAVSSGAAGNMAVKGKLNIAAPRRPELRCNPWPDQCPESALREGQHRRTAQCIVSRR
jgi:hypothetical protein